MTKSRKASVGKIAVASLAISLIAAAGVQAASTVTACVSKSTGIMRMISSGSCKKSESKVSWSTQGAAGPAGAPGTPGTPGAPGVPGANGKDGSSGKSGNTILSGLIDPTATDGADGDYFINTVTHTIFGPKNGTWPTGISLKGPSGAQGAAGFGAQGAAGPQGLQGIQGLQGLQGLQGIQGFQGQRGVSGARDSNIWFSPKDLDASRFGLFANNVSDASTVQNLDLTQNFFSAEVINITPGAPKVVFKPVPRGWNAATSLTVTVYWLTPVATTDPVAFQLYLGSRGPGSDYSSSDWGHVAAPNSPTNSFGASVSGGAYYLNSNTYTWYSTNLDPSGVLVSNGLLALSLYRPTNNDGDHLTDYTGTVDVMGVSIEANF